jgi:hypothetical protein
MRGILIAVAAAALAACSQQPGEAPLPADDALRQLILGPWHPAKDSDDYGTPEEDVFAADGTYVVNIYRDATCLALKGTGTFKWSLAGGILSTSAADSTDSPARDQILVLDEERLKTRSMETQEIYSRDKGYQCAERASGPPEPGEHQTESKAKPPVNTRPKSHFWRE